MHGEVMFVKLDQVIVQGSIFPREKFDDDFAPLDDVSHFLFMVEETKLIV